MTHLQASLRDPALGGTFVYYAVFVCLGMDMSLLGPTLPALARQTQASLGQMGLMVLIGSIGGVAGTALAGRAYDRASGHLVLGAAMLCEALLLASMPLAPSFAVLVAIAAVKGVSASCVNLGTNTLMMWTHREKVGPYMNALHLFFGLGAFLSPLLMAQLAGRVHGHQFAYFLLGGLMGLLGLRVVTLAGSPRPGSGEAAGSAAAGARGARVPWAFVASAALFMFFATGADVGFRSWIYTYALTLGLADQAGAAYLNSAFWLAFTVGRLVAIPIAVRLRPRQVIPTALCGGLAFIAAAVVFPGSSAVLWVASAGFGFCLSPAWPMGYTLAGQSVGLSGRVSSLILLGSSFGGMVLPSVLGRVIEAAGPRPMMALMFCDVALNLLAFAGMMRLRPVQPRGR